MEQFFIPADSSYHGCTQLAQYKYNGNVHGYIAAFTHLTLKIPNLSEVEKFDNFLCGLKPVVFGRVILQDPRSF